MSIAARRQRRRIRSFSREFGLLILMLGIAVDCAAATRYDWRLRFKTIRTRHFDIHAHQGEEALARRLARIVEDVRAQMQPVFGVPQGRVQVILVDQTDLANGWATPFPYDAIEMTAVPPLAETLIGNTDDWLRLVFTHEYTHILHLDRTGGWIRGVRRIFGRVPVVFPNTFLPIWQIEGIATFEESRMTNEGRVPAGDFRAIVDVAGRAGRFEPRDRAGGGLVAWPDGLAPYAYGAYFHQYLADRYGAERLARLADVTARRVPYFGAPAFKTVFGRSVGDLWKDFAGARLSNAPAPGPTDLIATRLTHHGFEVFAPRYGPDGTIYYAVVDAHRFPSLNKLSPAGVVTGIAPRVRGNRTSVRDAWIVFDQLERVRSVALYSDLYAVKTDGGSLHRLTFHARAGDPDLSPDGRRIACTVQTSTGRALAIFDFTPDKMSKPVVIVDEPETDFTGPRWSPDGSRLVVERRRRSGLYELVLVDVATRRVRPLVARANARLVTSSWLPDGRGVLFAANLDDRPFNIYAVSLDGRVRQVTDSTSGAQSPELSPDGRTLLYVGYTADGYDLFSAPVDERRWRSVEWPEEARPASGEVASAGELASYNPWRTLAPTYWTPIVETDADELLVGAGTDATDALGRHGYAVSAAWSGNRARPDWHAAYAYDRWWPTLFAGYSDDTDPITGGDIRSREALAGALLPFRHVRWTDTLLGAFDFQQDTLRCSSGCGAQPLRQRRASLRAGWIHDSRRQFGYSISAEEGVQVEVAAETTRAAFGSDADGGAAILDGRVFQRIFGRHTVVAGRAAFASGWGDRSVRRAFSAAGPGPSVAVFDFGRDTIGLLRGIAADDLVGSRAAVANVDVRLPLVYIQRGLGSWPIFFRSIHAAIFADAGQAWSRSFRFADVRTSTGGELSTDTVLGHYLPVTFTAGVAWTRDPVRARSGSAVFGRVGRAF